MVCLSGAVLSSVINSEVSLKQNGGLAHNSASPPFPVGTAMVISARARQTQGFFT